MPKRVFYLPYLPSRLLQSEQKKITERLFDVTISYIETSNPCVPTSKKSVSEVLSTPKSLKVVVQGRNYYNTKEAEDYITSVLPQEDSRLFSYCPSLLLIFGSQIWRDCVARAYRVLIETHSTNVLRVTGSTNCVTNAIFSMQQVEKTYSTSPKISADLKNLESVQLENAVAKYNNFNPPPGLYSRIHPQVIKILLKWLELAYDKPRIASSNEMVVVVEDEVITLDDSINQDEITVLGTGVANNKYFNETENSQTSNTTDSRTCSTVPGAHASVYDKENVRNVNNLDNSLCILDASDDINQSTDSESDAGVKNLENSVCILESSDDINQNTHSESDDITVIAVVSNSVQNKTVNSTCISKETDPLFVMNKSKDAVPCKKRKVKATLETEVCNKRKNTVEILHTSINHTSKIFQESSKQNSKAIPENSTNPDKDQRSCEQNYRDLNVSNAPYPAMDYIPLPPNPKGRLRPIVIDGSNVAIAHGKCRGTFSCKGIELCIQYFVQKGHTEVTAFVPRHRLYKNSLPPVVNKDLLVSLESKQLVVFTPSRKIGNSIISSYDDRFIIELASVNGGVVVSNDNYRDLLNESPEFNKTIRERLLMYCFVGDYFMIPQDPLGRSGPKIGDFLAFPPD